MVLCNDIREKIIKLVEPILLRKDIELVDVEYKMERGQWILRVYIDKVEGVTIDDCVEISRELGVTLDVKDLIPHRYNLEVSSPGLDRPLVKEVDFLKNTGKKIRIKVSERIDNRRNFSGILDKINKNEIILKGDQGEVWKIPFAKIEKARLIVDL